MISLCLTQAGEDVKSEPLSTGTQLIQQSFEQEILKYQGLALVDFWAAWCGPCHAIAPTVEKVAKDLAGRVKAGKVNVDDNQELSASYGISSTPTILFIKDGEVLGQVVGVVSANTLASKLQELLPSTEKTTNAA